MILFVTGSRSVTNPIVIQLAIDASPYNANEVEELVEGEASGADTLFKEWAESRGIKVTPFPADWSVTPFTVKSAIKYRKDGSRYNAAAGKERNVKMMTHACLEKSEGKDVGVLAVWDEESRGTKHMIDICRKADLPVFVYTKSDFLADREELAA